MIKLETIDEENSLLLNNHNENNSFNVSLLQTNFHYTPSNDEKNDELDVESHKDMAQDDIMYLHEHPLGVGFVDNVYKDVKIHFLDNIFISFVKKIQNVFYWFSRKKNNTKSSDIIHMPADDNNSGMNDIDYNDDLYYHPLNT